MLSQPDSPRRGTRVLASATPWAMPHTYTGPVNNLDASDRDSIKRGAWDLPAMNVE